MKRKLVWMAVVGAVLGAPAWAQTSGSPATDHSSHGVAVAQPAAPPSPAPGGGMGMPGGGMGMPGGGMGMPGGGMGMHGGGMGMHGGGMGMPGGGMGMPGGGMGMHGGGMGMHGGGMGMHGGGMGMHGGGMGQRGMGMTGPGMHQGGAMSGMGIGRGMGSMPMLAALDLSADQQTKVQKIHDDLRRRNWDALGKMLDERSRLRDLYAAPTFDSSALAATYKRIGELRQQMTEARLEAHAAVEQVLTQPQRDKLRQHWKQMGRRLAG